MAKPNKRGTCIFCGFEGDLTVEDALPQWVGRFFSNLRALDPNPPPEREIRYYSGKVRAGTLQRAQVKKVGNESVHKLPIVCERCNGGWMHDLEDIAAPLMKPMIWGDRTSLTISQQFLLAKWATKTTLLYGLLEDDEMNPPPELLRWFGEHQIPPTGTQLTLAAYDGTLGTVFHFRGLLHGTSDVNKRPPDIDRHSEFLTLVIGRLVFQVIVPLRVGERPLKPFRDPSPDFLQILPSRGVDLTWPPLEILGDDTIEAFAQVDLSTNPPTWMGPTA